MSGILMKIRAYSGYGSKVPIKVRNRPTYSEFPTCFATFFEIPLLCSKNKYRPGPVILAKIPGRTVWHCTFNDYLRVTLQQ